MLSTREKEKKYNNGRDISVTCKLSFIINLRKVKRICGTPLLRAYKWQKFLPFLKMFDNAKANNKQNDAQRMHHTSWYISLKSIAGLRREIS